MPRRDELAISVLMHHASSSAIFEHSDSEGLKHRVTRLASGSPKADGSNGISRYSSGCHATGSPFMSNAGSCFAPLNNGAKARLEVSTADGVIFLFQEHTESPVG